MKGKSYVTSLVAFYKRVTLLVDEGRASDEPTWPMTHSTQHPQHPCL